MNNFEINVGSQKFQFIGRFTKKQIYREELPKRGGVLRQFVDLKEGLVKNREGVFLRGEVDAPMYTMKLAITLTVISIYWYQCPRC